MYNIQRAIRDATRDFTEEFQQSFQGWKVRLKECVASREIYFQRYCSEIQGL
jgi:hypothetical protein